MVEQTTSTTQVNPTVGDKLKSAIGMGDTIRSTQTSTSTTGVPFQQQQQQQPMMMQSAPLAASRVIQEAPVIKTGTSTSYIADVHRKENIVVEERPIIQQNITKPVIEVHERHIERNVPQAPIMRQTQAPTVVQEIGRENLAFQAPLPNIATQTIQEASTVTNVKSAPIVAEVHHRPVIERHEQVIIHENRQQPITEVITQPIVQNIYEKPVIVKSTESIIESVPLVSTATSMTTGMATGMTNMGLQTTAIQQPVQERLGATSMSGGNTGMMSGNLQTTGLGSNVTQSTGIGARVRNALHLGQSSTTSSGLQQQSVFDSDFDPDKKLVQGAPATTTGVTGATTGVTGATIIPQKRF